jgi:hypothetical protein
MPKNPPPPTPAPPIRVNTNRWTRPLPKVHANFIPAQSWLAYSWLDKDPELDFVKYAIEDSGMTLEQIERECEKNGHKVSRWTLYSWMYGSTKRPQNATMNNVMAAIGWGRNWKRL